MKRIVLLLIILGMMDIAIPASAQQHKRTKHHRHYGHYQKNTTYTFPKAQKNREREKSLDDRTTGTPGKDEVKMNNKGKYHNMNANTGVDLPPSSGNNSK